LSTNPRASIGLFGGTFDPIHVGHLIGARDAAEQLGLQRVLIIPAPRAPLREPSRTDPTHRLAMAQLAVRGEPGLEASDIEVRRDGPSYSFDTANTLAALHPGTRLVWVIGADQLGQLHRWHRIHELTQLVEFACLVRPGAEIHPPAALPGLRWHRLASRPLQVSSSEIRQRAAAGLPLRWLVPDAVLDYIRQHSLYRTP
jgi:nicotinate-nucleotide adenylyltransferase